MVRIPFPFHPKRPSYGLYRRPSPLRVFFTRFTAMVSNGWPSLRLPLSLLAVAHLGLVALFPGGSNALFGVGADAAPAYLSLFPVGDTLGFYITTGRDGFLVYKIFTQDGQVLDGVFPDREVSPRLRYDRWAAASDVASGTHPALHALVVQYVLERLPQAPVRIELYAARWSWDRNGLSFPWPGVGLHTSLKLKMLGTYDGFTRVWKPVATKKGAAR